MPQCYVSGCGNYYGKTRGDSQIIYHMFPNSKAMVRTWAELCTGKSNVVPPPYSRICSKHFTSDAYQRDLQHELLGLPLRKKLKSGAVPSLNLPKQILRDAVSSAACKVPLSEISISAVLKSSPILEKNNVKKLTGKQLSPIKSKDSKEVLQNNKNKSEINVGTKNILQKLNDNSNVQEVRDPDHLKVPMRSSIRIAKKRSLECINETMADITKRKKINSKNGDRERFINKIKYMNYLYLTFEKNENNEKEVKKNFKSLPKDDLSCNKIIR